MSTSPRQLAILSLSFAAVGFLSLLGGIALAVFGVVGGAAAFVTNAGLSGLGSAAGITTVAILSGAFLALSGAPQLCAWYGIAQRKPWGRSLGIVLCTMSLAAFPIGTAFGAWGLSVLLRSEGVAAFGVKRSFVGDGLALAVGWMLMPSRRHHHDHHHHDHDYDRRHRGHRHARRSSGIGCFGLLVTLLALGMLFSCGSVVANCAGTVASGNAASSPLVENTPFANGPGSATGRAMGEYLRSVTGVGATDATSADDPVPAPVPDVQPQLQVEPQLEPRQEPRQEPRPPAPAPEKRKAIWIFKDKGGQSHIVDDYEKIPLDARATAHQAK